MTDPIQCPNCNRLIELDEEFVQRIVCSNREAAMQALGVRKEESALRPRFRMTPFVEHGPDGSHRIGLRRAH